MNKKEKIILFGASRGGENFIKHNKTQYDILAIADNDEKRWGRLLEGLKIINPKDILKYDFDELNEILKEFNEKVKEAKESESNEEQLFNRLKFYSEIIILNDEIKENYNIAHKKFKNIRTKNNRKKY